MKYLFAILAFVVGITKVMPQASYSFETQLTTSSGDHAPLWLNANKYGLSSIETTNGYVRAGLSQPVAADSARLWGWGGGVDLVVASGFTSTVVVQQAYAELRYRHGLLSVGSKEQPMELKHQQLSSGSQALGINARPVPELRLSLPDYWTVPGTNGLLAFKGHLAFGKYTDGRWQKKFTGKESRYVEDGLHHSKAAYVRIGRAKLYAELGLEMACQFGGGTKDVSGVNYDNGHGLLAYWHAFVPGGKDVTDGQFMNTEGNNLGSWVGRITYDQPSWSLSAYFDQYFEDQGMMFHLSSNGYGLGEDKDRMVRHRYFVYNFSDGLLGLELNLKNLGWLQTVVVEHLATKYQGGPVYHNNTANINEHICGFDNYYNHNLFTGWQHWGQVMGNPLYLSPIYNNGGQIEVLNNRSVAWHVGLGGQPLGGLSYRLLATWLRGYGTYSMPYLSPRENVCLLGEAEYCFPKSSGLRGLSLRGSVGLDRGEIYGDNLGVQLTAIFKGML